MESIDSKIKDKRELYIINKNDMSIYVNSINNSLKSPSINFNIIEIEERNERMPFLALKWQFLNYSKPTITLFNFVNFNIQSEQSMKKIFNLLKEMAKEAFEKIPNLETQQGYEINMDNWPEQVPDEYEGIFQSLISYK
jgi:hypothetical protein